MIDTALVLPPLAPDEVERSVPERFARVVAACPSVVAVAVGSERLTYAELDRRSARLASAIAARSAAGPAPVAVLADDPIARIAGMLGTWRAGRACVAIDPGDPEARVAAILRDAGAALVLTEGGARGEAAAALGAAVLRMDAPDLRDAGAGGPGEPPCVPIPPETPLSLVYTSGSTGAPKGVVRSHRNQLHRTRCMVDSIALRPGDRMTALHAPSSAVGLRDVLAALLTGATLLPFDVRRAGLGALARWIDAEAITALCATATTFRHLMAAIEPERRFVTVRAVRLGSEPVYRQDVEAFRRHFPADAVLVTGYGASEASGIAQYRIGPGTPLPAGRVPAGYPIEGVELLVVDDAGEALPPGETGEIVVRSRFLSPGYWQRADLTGAAFAGDGAGGAPRRYRTGDVGRLDPDGCLVVLGRRDDQVKVRGYRVQPGEVEAALREHAAVREALVLGRLDAQGETQLVAYVVPEPPGSLPALALRRFLRARLPAHLVPAAFVGLDGLPTLPTGKVDRAALPPPGAAAGGRETSYAAPDSVLEHQIAEIWERLLDVRPVGVDDDFFDLGGNSLLAAAFVTALEGACGRTLSPAALVEHSTIAGLAGALVREEAAAHRVVVPLRETGRRPPLFFLHGENNGGGLYCHALARCLDPDRPFYAVHPHGLGGGRVPATIEAMAEDLLPAIRAAWPHGPYALAGHCKGGYVALELASRLRAAGERVVGVVLAEAEAPDAGLRALHRASAAAGRLGVPAAPRARLVARAEHGSEALAYLARYYRHRAGDLARAGLHAQAGAVGRLLRRGARRLAGVVPGGPAAARAGGAPAGPAGLPPQREGQREAYHRAIRRYCPPAYPGPVTVIAALEEPPRPAALGWAAVLPHVTVTAVPGDHVTCVTRHVAAFARALDRALADG